MLTMYRFRRTAATATRYAHSAFFCWILSPCHRTTTMEMLQLQPFIQCHHRPPIATIAAAAAGAEATATPPMAPAQHRACWKGFSQMFVYQFYYKLHSFKMHALCRYERWAVRAFAELLLLGIRLRSEISMIKSGGSRKTFSKIDR